MSGYITRNALMTDNPTFGAPTQSSVSPTTLANPLAWGAQPGVQSGTGGVDLAMPTAPAGNPAMSNDDLRNALAALYGQLGGGVDWVKFTGGSQGPLGQATTGQAPAAAPGQPGQQPGGGAQALVDAYEGFKQYSDINQQIQQAKRLFDNPDGGYHGREGGGVV